MEFSRFAHKFSGDSGILQLMADLGQPVPSGQPFHMLGGGNPADIPAMNAVFREEMAALLADGDRFEHSVGRYDAPQGSHRFLEALAGMLNEAFGWQVEADNVAVTNGSQASFGVLFNLFAGRFDDQEDRRILLPLTPEYIGYSDVGLGQRPIFRACTPEITDIDDDPLLFKYAIDFNQLEVTDGDGAICVSRPTNPSGNVITDDEIAHLDRMAQAAGIPLIIDGAYGLPFPAMVNVAANPTWNANIVLCLSLSKLGLPGLRTGIVVADRAIIERLTAANAIFNLAPGSMGPALVTRLVEQRSLIALCQRHVTPFYRQRAASAVEQVRTLMGDLPVRVHRTEGSMFLWLWFDDPAINSDDLYRKLKARGVFVLAGHHFFPGLEQDWIHRRQCIRVSYAASPGDLEAGLAIIADEVRKAARQ